MYYKGTIAAVRAAIEEAQPGTQAVHSDLIAGEGAPLSHLLWMCDEMQKMDIDFVDEAVKAGRWMGWILAGIEFAGMWDNSKSRNLIREDRRDGFDKPHQE